MGGGHGQVIGGEPQYFWLGRVSQNLIVSNFTYQKSYFSNFWRGHGAEREPKIIAQDQEVLVEIIVVTVLELHEIWLVEGKHSFDQKLLLYYEVRLNFDEFLH